MPRPDAAYFLDTEKKQAAYYIMSAIAEPKRLRDKAHLEPYLPADLTIAAGMNAIR